MSWEARKHLTVILNGDGGDEILAAIVVTCPFARYDFFDASLVIRAGSRRGSRDPSRTAFKRASTISFTG